MTEDKKTKEEKKQYEVVQVATETQPAIQTPEGKYLSGEEAMVKILNDIEMLKEKLFG